MRVSINYVGRFTVFFISFTENCQLHSTFDKFVGVLTQKHAKI